MCLTLGCSVTLHVSNRLMCLTLGCSVTLIEYKMKSSLTKSIDCCRLRDSGTISIVPRMQTGYWDVSI